LRFDRQHFNRWIMRDYKIEYKCMKLPHPNTGLKGFDLGKNYLGRAFNGLVEVSPDWGRDPDAKLIDLAVFKKYFEEV